MGHASADSDVRSAISGVGLADSRMITREGVAVVLFFVLLGLACLMAALMYLPAGTWQ